MYQLHKFVIMEPSKYADQAAFRIFFEILLFY
jgi:hypothetical protein